MDFEYRRRRRGMGSNGLLLSADSETAGQGLAAGSLPHRNGRVLTGLAEHNGPQPFDWDAAVALHASDVWRRARAASPSRRDALEVFQLVWLRLELATRDGQSPEHLSEWLIQEVDRECSPSPYGSADVDPAPQDEVTPS